MYSLRYKLLYVSYNQVQGCELIGYTYPITRFKVANVLVIQIVMYLQSGSQIAIFVIIHIATYIFSQRYPDCDFWIL